MRSDCEEKTATDSGQEAPIHSAGLSAPALHGANPPPSEEGISMRRKHPVNLWGQSGLCFRLDLMVPFGDLLFKF